MPLARILRIGTTLFAAAIYPSMSMAYVDVPPRGAPVSQHEKACNLSSVAFSEVLSCYQRIVRHQPIVYTHTGHRKTGGVEQRTYHLTSQHWPTQTSPWQHDVTLYIPEQALPKRALLVVNDGTQSKDSHPTPSAAPRDFTHEMLIALARDTHTVIVSISDVPNQHLTLGADDKPRAEDDLVARSWTLFLDDPQKYKAMPLHLPMAAAASRAMTLAERELGALNIHRFIISGFSKRAWASWLTTISDARVEAILPFAIDLLNVQKSLDHIYRSYGNNWPIALGPYIEQKLETRFDSPAFASMMQIEDPLQYLSTSYKARLEVPKYLVNASGDDFFVPDNASLYYDRLPGAKALRMVPNVAHGDIRQVVAQSLTGFVNRVQAGKPLAHVEATLRHDGTKSILHVQMSEAPRTLKLWQAMNPKARDFRYACGTRYTATPLAFSKTDGVEVLVETPSVGWGAYFVEATFEDGFVATSQTYILGKVAYPNSAPPSLEPGCKTLPG